MMSLFLPTSFADMIAGVLTIAAILLALLSLRARLRLHATKMFAIFFAAALAVFANHWATYFAALFIVATAVTELEFLQNLAAIIRGNKPYFDYKKEQLSPEEAERTIDARLEHGLDGGRARPAIDRDIERRRPSRLSRSTFRSVVEQLAAKKLGEIFGGPVELHVRFASNGLRVEIEGVIQANGACRDKLFGFEYVRKGVEAAALVEAARRLDELAPRYAVITRRPCEFHLVILILDKTELAAETVDTVQRAIDRSEYVVSIRVLTRGDIGLDLVDDEVWR